MDDGNVIRLSPLRPAGTSLKSPSSGRSTPRGSPSFRRLNSNRTPRLNSGRSNWFSSQIFRSNRIVLWLLLITLWAYAGFYFQSRWAHGDNKEDLFSGGYGGESSGDNAQQLRTRRDLIDNPNSGGVTSKSGSNQSSLSNGILGKSRSNGSLVSKSPLPKKQGRRSRKKNKGKTPNVIAEATLNEGNNVQEEEEIPKTNATYGLIVGPFGSLEDEILEWNPHKRSGTCDRKGAFARLVWSRKFVLIFHELSMTGAPLAMLELASEFLSCGATITVIVLNKKGGLMPELARRKIKVLEDKSGFSFKTAMKADLIIAGSAVCSSWIEQYLSRTVLGSSQIMWWIMENRREYFDRSKSVLNRVKKLIFISQSQSNQWLQWCEEESIELKSKPSLVPLSVNDELAFVSGIPCSLNSPSFTTEIMSEKRRSLREAVRKEMGLNDEDMLVLTLSSINPGKGQFLLLESARLMMSGHGSMLNSSAFKDYSNMLDHKDYQSRDGSMRKILSSSSNSGKMEQNIKVLIGSVGSKSNKVPYVKTLLRFLSAHSNLSRSVLWTPATTRVASLYSAADVYVMNSQGIGETFGRVTIEAMAFGLPILGTDSGGTREIVEHNVTGLLHPLGRPGARVLAKNLKFMLENPSTRHEMGVKGREKVEKMYLKKHMYQKFGEVLYKNMRIK